MKIIIRSASFLATLVAILLTGCSKQNTQHPLSTMHLQTPGYHHNLSLSKMPLGIEGATLSITEIEQRVKHELATSLNVSPEKLTYHKCNFVSDNRIIKSPDFSSILNDKRYSPATKEVLRKITQIAKNNINSKQRQLDECEVLTNEVKQMNLEKTELAMLLGTLSIMQYSTTFWLEAQTKLKSSSADISTKTREILPPYIEFVDAVAFAEAFNYFLWNSMINGENPEPGNQAWNQVLGNATLSSAITSYMAWFTL